ncbi:hypothetical protein IEO21_10745 [Rhodonia placenta]|uniref:Uncharacterized protein n=1 Tax=Rhodonia placenta TaxID=104341 RepID=A0A8H7TX56_9APHY|nr:hypothetical protein IEO21_10745 [Postia placenta]
MPKTPSTFTSLRDHLPSSSPVNNNCALIACPDQSNRTPDITEPSEGLNICSVPAVPTHLNPRSGNPAPSPLARASLKLSPIQVKEEEIPISLQTLRQSQSLTRVRVKKESQSPSIHFTVGPHRWTHSPPRLHLSGRQPQPPPPPLHRPPSPSPPIMSSPTSPPDKETLKHCHELVRRLAVFQFFPFRGLEPATSVLHA